MVRNDLEDRILGCIAGAQVGSALGDPVEGWTAEAIEAEYGWLDFLDSREEGGEIKPPGTTEDGIERQKLQILSIIDNNGPITGQELARTWLEYIDADMFGKREGFLAGKQDQIHFELIAANIPPEDSGYHDAHPGRVGPHRASHANGVVNACYPRLAAQYAIDIARLYQPPKGRGVVDRDPTYTIGLDWSGAVCAAIAAAMRPDATKDDVVDAATEVVIPEVADAITEGVAIGREHDDYESLRAGFYEVFHGRNSNFGMTISRANEIVPKAFGLFVFYDDVRAVMEGAANFGRDTDCLCALAAGFMGAFTGSETIPDEWIAQVDEAATMSYERGQTCTDLSLADQAAGLYDATVAHHERIQQGAGAFEKLRA